MAVAGRLSRRPPVPAPPGLPRLRDRAGQWETDLREDAVRWARALPPRAPDAAVANLRELGPVQPDTLVHGDLHARNILSGEREPWPAVDPKGYAGGPAHDSGTLLKSRGLVLVEADDLGRAADRVLDASSPRPPGSIANASGGGPGSTPSRPRSGAAATASGSPAADRHATV